MGAENIYESLVKKFIYIREERVFFPPVLSLRIRIISKIMISG